MVYAEGITTPGGVVNFIHVLLCTALLDAHWLEYTHATAVIM